ncbi:hypothetical protein [Acidovorax sp. A1169]|uniref:hypothetical protein n=1 Tax=Acidovorax sp. A1169 TaxID=3059524 RepID=UPI002737A2F7|nr:hypothetical protein [Acidovorax sp. A1169]MDP4078527.1 hypothetical protein [Acidovorax sp. A1169]
MHLPQIKLEPSRKPAELTSLGLPPGDSFVVWWYGAIKNNLSENWVRRVVVWFRHLREDGTLGEFCTRDAALTSLGQLRIGSVWKNGISKEQVKFARRRFKVTFSADTWTGSSSCAEYRSAEGPDLIPEEAHPLFYRAGDRSKLLLLEHAKGRLLIPCLEFLRCYGREQNINRILTLYEWNQVVESLHLDVPVEPQSGAAVIDLPARLGRDEAHLLAHLRYFDFARQWVPRIKSEIDLQLGSPKDIKALAFPTIGPWFRGLAEIEVEGVETGSGDFLGLRIVGYTVPAEPAIVTLRSEFPIEGTEEYSTRPYPIQRFRRLDQDEVTPVADDQAPDNSAEIVLVPDPSIRFLGQPAPVSVRSRKGEVERNTPGPMPLESKISAPGNARGSGKGIGRAEHHSKAELEQEGAILDLWRGLKYLKTLHPGVITRLASLTASDTLSADLNEQPRLASLSPNAEPGTGHSLTASAKKWLFLDANQPKRPRGVLIVEVNSNGSTGYLFEVERAVRGPNLLGEMREEEYCGLAVRCPRNVRLQDWMPRVLFWIAQNEGKMKRVASSIPWLDAREYRRSFSASDVVIGQSTAMNALEKLGMEFPVSTPLVNAPH